MTNPDASSHASEAHRGRGLRSLLSSTSQERRLAEVIETHRRELEEHTARFEETLADLERREQLLSDARASIERLLRLGAKDLDAREADIVRLVADLTEREQRVREHEADVTRRRSELGAVELKRLALEQRERALEARETTVGMAESEILEAAALEPTSELAALAFVPGTRYRICEIAPLSLSPGDSYELEGESLLVARVGPSPLPADRRRCVYLVRGPRPPSSSDGSS